MKKGKSKKRAKDEEVNEQRGKWGKGGDQCPRGALKAFILTRMWANAQRDGRPAKHKWHPLFNAAKFGWRPLLDDVQ